MRQEVTPQVQENNCTKAKVQLLVKKNSRLTFLEVSASFNIEYTHEFI